MALIEVLGFALNPIISLPPIKRIRQNHALEHATIHMLNRQHYVLSGRASLTGYVIMGDVPTEKVKKAAEEALSRLRDGQKKLAVHPNCGTNLVTAGMMFTSIAAVGFQGTDRKRAWERFPLVMLVMMLAALYSTPIGMLVQEHITTEADPEQLAIVQIKRSEWTIPFRDTPIILHRIGTK